MSPIIGPNNFFKAAYVINVAARKDRREQFESMVSQLNIGEITRFEAIRDHADGAWGCAQSHMAIIRMAKEQGLENVLIFEDDCLLSNTFESTINSTLSQLMSHRWDFFYIGARLIAPARLETPNLARIIGAYTTHAYAISHTMYDEILAYDHKKYKAIDVLYSFLTRHNNSFGDSFCMYPIGAYQRAGVSDLIGGHVDYKDLLDWSFRDCIKHP